ncbi:hypothetical protein SAY87_008881 [Trapa incisa]|uniref:Uncharacterized protein n=1 Tax=Trapa incisa TaxID=236973 RepID=A0AAN7JWW3_9MYRT|nr:hypothetical protein SAY87_008881 [Trapa incisa]
MQLFVKFSAGIVLDSWNELNRSHFMVKLIFLDQLCETSPFLPRSTLEAHVPYTILRSTYSQYHGNLPSTSLALITASPCRSPTISHASPVSRHTSRSDSTPQHSVNDSSYFQGSSSAHPRGQYFDGDHGSTHSSDGRHRNARRSGPGLQHGPERENG